MNIDEFEYLIDNCSLKTNDNGEHIFFQPIKPKSAKIAYEIIKNNHLENLSKEEMSGLFQKYYPIYQSRKDLKEHQFSLMSTQEAGDLPLEKKLEYLETLFFASQTLKETINVCKKNEDNIRACLFNMDFPKNFWVDEKKSTDRYVNLIVHQPQIVDKLKHWQQISLDDKKAVIEQAVEAFEDVYGLKPEVVYFTPEEERAKNRAQGLPEDTHIDAAYQQQGKIYFNEERLSRSDNFFAISVLFHEGTHLRQRFETFKDPLVDRILNCSIDNVTVYENIVNDKESTSYKDLYTMQPAETHAHGLQEYVEQQITEKTGIEKTQYATLDSKTKKIHDKAFAMAKLTQYRSSQKK